jgi:hypothetical protein
LAKRLGAVGGRQHRTVTTEKFDADFSFERPDALTHGSGRNPKFKSGAGEIAVSNAGSQNAQRVKRRQSFRHASFEATLQMIVKDCGHGSTAASLD